MMLANLARAGSTSAIFFSIGGFLGASGLAIFAAIGALTAILLPFSAFGFGGELIRRVAQNEETLDSSVSKAIILVVFSALFILPLLLLVWNGFYGELNVVSLIIWAISEVVFSKIVEIISQAYQATKNIKKCSAVIFFQAVTKLASVGIVIFCFDTSLMLNWVLSALALNIMCALIVVIFLMTADGVKLRIHKIYFRDIKMGIYFSFGLSSQGVYNDADKLILAKFSSDLVGAGVYAMAYKIVDFSCMPIKSLLAVKYAGFFEHGKNGILGSFEYAKVVLKKSIKIGVFASVASFAAALFFGFVYENNYPGIYYCAAIIAAIPIIRSIHYVLGDSITGAGFQNIRSIAQLGVAIFSVVISVPAAMIYGHYGVAVASVVGDIFLALVFLIIIKRLK